jgi:hypothetical protein
MRRSPRLGAAAAALALSLLFLGASVADAAEPAIRAQAEAMGDGSFRLTAKVTTAEGGAQSQTLVTFLAATEFLGSRWVPVGTAVSDTSGTATVLYNPTWNGEQRLIARAAGPQGALESEPISIEVSGALPGVNTEPPDLPIVRAWALPIGVLVVVVVWLVLAFIFLSAVVGIARRRPLSSVSEARASLTGAIQTAESPIDGGSSS